MIRGLKKDSFGSILQQISTMRAVAFLLLVLGLSSCVSSKVHKDLLSRYSALEAESDSLRNAEFNCRQLVETLNSDLEKCRTDVAGLQADTAESGKELRKMNRNYADLSRSYDFLLENNNALLTNSARENKKMLERLQELDMRLQDEHDSLVEERANLSELTARLAQREARVKELESVISKQDSVVRYIQNMVSDALSSYTGKGLTVENRGGKVYVSLDNRLLFESAKWTLNVGAKEALGRLAEVLAANPELSITVEGHTDSDAFSGRNGVRDNWDLSVMRATAVVKELTAKEGVDPSSIVASGRGEFAPIAENDTDENKAKNRRTEVIITPDLSALAELMDSSAWSVPEENGATE